MINKDVILSRQKRSSVEELCEECLLKEGPFANINHEQLKMIVKDMNNLNELGEWRELKIGPLPAINVSSTDYNFTIKLENSAKDDQGNNSRPKWDPDGSLDQECIAESGPWSPSQYSNK